MLYLLAKNMFVTFVCFQQLKGLSARRVSAVSPMYSVQVGPSAKTKVSATTRCTTYCIFEKHDPTVQ